MTLDNSRLLSVNPYMRKRFASVGQKLRFSGDTAAAARAWQRKARAKLRELLGLNTMQRCSPRPCCTEKADCGDYVRERIEMLVEPGIPMPFYALVPKKGTGPFPTLLAPHGHGGGGKVAVAGVTDCEEIKNAIAHYNYDYGVQFCKAGFLVLCPDARGFGERQEIWAKQSGVLVSSCVWINNMAIPLGQTVTGMWTWDLMRLIDYAETRPDCDTSRLGCAGLSGGGYQTLILAALDERVRAAVDSGYFYGAREALLDKHGNCSCNYIPHAWEFFDHGDWGALVAPRPFMIQSGDEDPLNGASGLKNVRSQLAIARKVYAALGAAKNLQHDVFHGPHRWDNTNSIPFLKKHLMG